MPIAILTVGFKRYAFQNPSNATKILELLGKGIAVEWTSEGYVQEPITGRSEREITVELVPATKLVRPPKRVPESHRLGFSDPM